MGEQPKLPDGARDTAELLEHFGDEHLPSERWPQTLAELVAVFEATLQRQGFERDQALQLSRALVLSMAEHLGGQPIYLPRGDKLRTALDHIQAWHDFDGRNLRQLARRLGVSVRHMQRILAEQKALHARKLQGRLFEE